MTALSEGYIRLQQPVVRGGRAVATLFIGLLVAVLTAGCAEPAGDASQDQDLQSGNERSMGPDRLLEQRGDLEARETSWSSGDASSRARGYFRDDRLVYIDEEVDQGEFGSTRDEYLLHDGQLIHFRRVGELPDLSDTDRPGFRDIELEILFDLDGRARVVRNLEDGIDRELDDTELQTIRSHFVIVRDRLLDEEA